MRAHVALLLALAGCSTFEPTPLDPSALLAELRDVRVELPAAGLAPSDAVALALVHNPELRVARRNHEIAAGLVVSGSAWENPELRVSLDKLYSRIHDPFSYALDLRFFPPLPDELDAKRERLLARERRVLAEIEESEARVAEDALVAHAQLVLLDTELATVRSAVRLHERIDEFVRQQIAAGATTRVDATLVLLRREELTDELQSLVARREIAQAELAALLGAPPDASIVVAQAPASVDPRAEQRSQAALEDDALQRRPDLRALAEAYEEREQQLRLRHLAKTPWPRHVQAGVGGHPADTTIDVDLAIELPLTGAADAKIAVAESRRDRARDAYRARLHVVRGDIRLAWLDLREQDRRRRHLADRVEPILRQAEELVGSALQAGAANVLAVVAIETRVLDARRAAAQSAHDYELARIRLAAAIGTIHELS